MDLDRPYLAQVENNQTLIHLVDLFKEIPNQNFIEKEKRLFLNRVFHDIINKIGRNNIENTDHEYWIKTNIKRQEPLNLPIPYLLTKASNEYWANGLKIMLYNKFMSI